VSRTNDTICLQDRASSIGSADDNVRANPRAYHLIVLLACAGVLAASFILRPTAEGLSLFGYPWPLHCWLHETTGIRCALCGISRSFCSLAHGDIAAGLAFHRLGLVTFAFFCLQIPYRLYAWAIQPGRIDRRIANAHFGLAALLCAAMAGNWFVYLEGWIV